jgi:hypothetical protein
MFGAQALGAAIGPAAGGLLADHYGIMATFLFPRRHHPGHEPVHFLHAGDDAWRGAANQRYLTITPDIHE